jgi:hypothetical protein
MAYSVTSAVVSDQKATPIAKVSPVEKGGVVRSAYGFATVLATTVGQTNAFVRIPARARIESITAVNATMGDGALAFDLYRTNETRITTGGSVMAIFALTAHTEAAPLAPARSEANMAKDLATWFATAIGTAGATNDVEFDLIGVVLTVSTGTAVPVGIQVQYVSPD